LFICAKHLFFAAMLATNGRQELRRSSNQAVWWCSLAARAR
jgi:hypothetical protein